VVGTGCVIDHDLVGLAACPTEPPPDAAVVATGEVPQRRDGERAGGSGACGGHRQNLLDRPRDHAWRVARGSGNVRPMKSLVVLVVAALVSTAACGGDDAESADTSSPATSSPATPTVTEAPVTDPPRTDPSPTAAPTTTVPATDAPTTPAPAPTTAPPATEAPATIPEMESPHGSIGDNGAFQITANVVGGQPEGGVRSYLVETGMTVQITVISDTADEVHLHGYDLEGDLQPGVPFVMTFTAAQQGSFELELHDSGALLLYLDVA
jgi:hypothetical protein